MEKRFKNEEPILPGNDAGILSGSAPQQGIRMNYMDDELAREEPVEDSQKRKPVKAKEKEKLDKKKTKK